MKRILVAAAIALPFAAHAFPTPSQDDYREHTAAQVQAWKAAGSATPMKREPVATSATERATAPAGIQYPTGS